MYAQNYFIFFLDIIPYDKTNEIIQDAKKLKMWHPDTINFYTNKLESRKNKDNNFEIY